MVAAVHFQDFVEQLGLGLHDLDGDTIKIALTDVLPVNTQTVFDSITNHAAMTNENGYTALGHDVLAAWSESAGTATLAGTDVTITATAGGIGQFQYIVMYNDTNASNGLMVYYDHGSAVNLAEGESYVFDILTNILTLVGA